MKNSNLIDLKSVQSICFKAIPISVIESYLVPYLHNTLNHLKDFIMLAGTSTFNMELFKTYILVLKDAYHAKKNFKRNVVHHCVNTNDLLLLKILINSNENLNIVGKSHTYLESFMDNTPLGVAAYKNNVEMIMLLLRYGADINSVNRHNKTPLYIACKFGCVNAVKVLLQQRRVDIFISESVFNVSPLHIAAKHGFYPIVSLLLHHSSMTIQGVNQRDIRGNTALNAVASRNGDIKRLLTAHGAISRNVNQQDAYFNLFV